MKFNIGDVVIVNSDVDGAPTKGRIATIVGWYHNDIAALDFGEPVGKTYGHTCEGLTKKGQGWHVFVTEFTLADKKANVGTPIERKMRRLWNSSKFVKKHSTLAY